MKQLTFVRHGQTESNRTGDFNLATEPLNAAGQAQAQLAAENLKHEEFDLVLCSPLPRTCMTAEAIMEGRDTVIEYWSELEEVDWGNYQGQPRPTEIEPGKDFCGIRLGLYAESSTDLLRRAQQFWARLKARPEKRILVVSHGAIMCILWAVYEGYAPDEFEHYRFDVWERMDNCDMKRLDWA